MVYFIGIVAALLLCGVVFWLGINYDKYPLPIGKLGEIQRKFNHELADDEENVVLFWFMVFIIAVGWPIFCFLGLVSAVVYVVVILMNKVLNKILPAIIENLNKNETKE